MPEEKEHLFKKGHNKGGRPKGLENKMTRTVRDTVLAVFNKLQEEPEKGKPDVRLETWASKEPSEFYKIASKLIPTEVTGKIKNIIIVKADEEDE